jgi:predicted phage replisome organizer
MADIKWVKVATDMFDGSRKIKQIETMQKGDTILVIWLKLLLLAGSINDGGKIYITPGCPYDVKALANELRRPLPTVKAALDIFTTFGMIETVDGIIFITSWERHQNTAGMERVKEQTRARVAKCREKKNSSDGVTSNADVTQCNATCNATVTQCNAIEEEEEEERDIHSFVLSARDARDARVETMRTALGGIGKGVVMLSEEQMNELLERLSLDEFNRYVAVVADAELAGKHYRKKTHYQAILDMAEADRRLTT